MAHTVARMPTATKTRPRTAKRAIDTRWFQAAMAVSKYPSLRELAPHLANRSGQPMDKMTLWELFHGKRRMALEDARRLADLLERPFAEVCRRAGIDAREDDLESRHREAVKLVATLAGYCDEHGVKLPARIRDAIERVR